MSRAVSPFMKKTYKPEVEVKNLISRLGWRSGGKMTREGGVWGYSEWPKVEVTTKKGTACR